MSDSTTACVRAARRGDRDALGRVIERFTPWLLAQARLRLHGRLSALISPEDLVQDTWLIALHRLPDLQEREQRLTPVLVRFLATTLRRRLCDLLERELGRAGVGTAPVSELATSIGESCRLVSVRERADALWDVIRTMPSRDQSLIVLRGLEGVGFHEIGLLLGIDADAAMSAWARTRRRLRARLEPLLRDDLET
jgi:RNA polymerase sigma factor (sigma-70 family)